jgi:hypothetical protein
MTDQEQTDRLIDQISETLSRDPRFPRLGFLERELLFRDLQRELDEIFERIFEAGYQEGWNWAKWEGEDADHHGR